MTSQIALINQSGMAISSDTLVSRRAGHGGHKTYPGSSKIFPVGDGHKVVVLHSGLTTLGRVHYQMLVREWALQLNQPLPHLDDYAENFTEWVGAGSRKIQIEETGRSGTIDDCICAELRDLSSFYENDFASAFATSDNSVASTELESELQRILNQYEADYFTNPNYPDLTDEKITRLLRNAELDVVQHFNEHFPEREYSGAFQATIHDFVVKLLGRYVPGNVANLVFAGFGSEEPGAGTVELNVRSYYAGKLRFNLRGRYPKDGEVFPTWRLIAQQDAMASFLRGVDAGIRSRLVDTATWAAKTELNVGDDALAKFTETFKQEVDTYLWESFETHMLDTVGGLGIASLARFSDALVRMQSLRSASLGEEATVGGLIETVTISRDNGVQWLRRIPLDVNHSEESGHVFG